MPSSELFAAAAREGIITDTQAERLTDFSERFAAGNDAAPDISPDAPPDAEAPRFVRGFHDILVTIGLVLGLSGLGTLVQLTMGDRIAAFAVIALAAAVLSEVLVRRLRLALPAIALAIAFTTAAGALVGFVIVEPGANLADDGGGAVAAFLSAAVAAGLYFAAYRVPFSLALAVGSAGIAVVLGYFVLTDTVSLGPAGEALVLGLALAVFALALGFDFSDPDRKTRRSDYAFWLHLMAAPALIGSVMNLLVGFRSVFQIEAPLSTSDSAVVLGVMAAMSVLAILIDRRAFLIAGLSYFGVAVFAFTEKISLQDEITPALTVFILGVVILILALGWRQARRLLISPLPGRWARCLPPVRLGEPAAASSR